VISFGKARIGEADLAEARQFAKMSGYTCHFIRPNWTLPHRAEKAKSGASGVSAA
jgi:hypothetical protein